MHSCLGGQHPFTRKSFPRKAFPRSAQQRSQFRAKRFSARRFRAIFKNGYFSFYLFSYFKHTARAEMNIYAISRPRPSGRKIKKSNWRVDLVILILSSISSVTLQLSSFHTISRLLWNVSRITAYSYRPTGFACCLLITRLTLFNQNAVYYHYTCDGLMKINVT